MLNPRKPDLVVGCESVAADIGEPIPALNQINGPPWQRNMKYTVNYLFNVPNFHFRDVTSKSTLGVFCCIIILYFGYAVVERRCRL